MKMKQPITNGDSVAEPSLIQIRPRHEEVTISRGRTVLATGLEGTISSNQPRQGLWIYETRVLSAYRWLINGEQPKLSVFSPVQQHTSLGYYFTAPSNWKATETHESDPLQQTVELRVSRAVGEGLHEEVEVTNHTQVATSLKLALEVRAAFVSHKEAGGRRKERGRMTKTWSKQAEGVWELSFDYRARHAYHHQDEKGIARFHRGIVLHLQASSPAKYEDNTISFPIRLKPHARWRCCLRWVGQLDGNPLPLESTCGNVFQGHDAWSQLGSNFLKRIPSFEVPNHAGLSCTVHRVLDRSQRDLASLRLFDLDEGIHNWKMAGGVPSYLALFGRDSLAAAWQASLLSQDMLIGALSAMADTQATTIDNWRDAQPGRMMHERHTDPLSVLNFSPAGLDYRGVTTSFLYPTMVSEVWHWTGDKDLVSRFIDPAVRALAWADRYSRSRSGFYKYHTKSAQGMKNQGWKDSKDAIVYPDGSQVPDPIGTCEMQGFAYAAKLHFAEVLWWFDRKDEARRLFEEAQSLKERFNKKFWLEETGYLAMAIDADDRLVKSVGSDPGHCILSGIVDEDRVARIAWRLLQSDMFSGWGVRTLDSKHPAFNPFAYHRGTVWPVENAAFVLAFARYGFRGEMWTLAKALFEAAGLFEYDRLPETFGGHARDLEHPFPGLYEKADSPQAWSASAPFTILQALLGIYPYAPLHTMFVDPALPEWLPEITVRNLHIGEAKVSFRFWRKSDGETDFKVFDLTGKLHVIRQPSPWSITANWAERIHDMVLSLLRRA